MVAVFFFFVLALILNQLFLAGIALFSLVGGQGSAFNVTLPVRHQLPHGKRANKWMKRFARSNKLERDKFNSTRPTEWALQWAG